MSARVIPELVAWHCSQRAAFDWQPAPRNRDAWPGALRTAPPCRRVAYIECVFQEHDASQFVQQILQAQPLFPRIS